MNLDTSELNKFNAVADSWWDPKGNFRPLHDMNPVRLDWIKTHASLENRDVLDIGCGGGILSESLAKEKAIVTGIDLASNAIETARSHSIESNLSIRYLISSAEELADMEPAKYDVVTCMELLEHVPDPIFNRQGMFPACKTGRNGFLFNPEPERQIVLPCDNRGRIYPAFIAKRNP